MLEVVERELAKRTEGILSVKCLAIYGNKSHHEFKLGSRTKMNSFTDEKMKIKKLVFKRCSIDSWTVQLVSNQKLINLELLHSFVLQQIEEEKLRTLNYTCVVSFGFQYSKPMNLHGENLTLCSEMVSSLGDHNCSLEPTSCS